MSGNPFRTYSHYATRVLSDADTVVLASEAAKARLRSVVSNRMNTFADATLAPRARRVEIIELLEKGPATIGTILQTLQPREPDRVRRTVSWMLKCDILRVV